MAQSHSVGLVVDRPVLGREVRALWAAVDSGPGAAPAGSPATQRRGSAMMRGARRIPRRPQSHVPSHAQAHQADRSQRAAEGTDFARPARAAGQGSATDVVRGTPGRPVPAAHGDRARTIGAGPPERAPQQVARRRGVPRRTGAHGCAPSRGGVEGDAPRARRPFGATARHHRHRTFARHGRSDAAGLRARREADRRRSREARTGNEGGVRARRPVIAVIAHEARSVRILVAPAAGARCGNARAGAPPAPRQSR